MFRIAIKENEKALIYKDEKFEKILNTGLHKFFHIFQNYRVERVAVEAHGIINPSKNRLLYKNNPQLIEEQFNVVKLEEYERAYVWVDGKFVELLEAGALRLYWREYDVTIEKIDVRESYIVEKKHRLLLDQKSVMAKNVIKMVVKQNSQGYLYVDEKFESLVEEGKHFYYTDFYDIDLKVIDKRVKELEITGQELLSSDKVTLRCNLTMHYKIIDGKSYLESVDDANTYLYKQLQFAVREHLGAMNIDEILSKQHTLSDEILAKFYAICKKIGVEVEGVYIKDIILPGEIREIFNQVIEASKRAEANNIKRREETSSTRSLLNTAKLMNDNPALARLKELEALEKITQTIGTLNVYGGLDGVMNGLVDLKVE